MSYSNLSPSSQSSDSNSQRSWNKKINSNLIHDPTQTEGQRKNSKSEQQHSDRNSRMNHMLKTVNSYLSSYELYVKLLLGRDIKKVDEKIMMNKWGKFIIKAEENMLPEAVLKFPNPDCPVCEEIEILSPLETILFIEKVLKLDLKKIDNRIFLKAIEGVFTKLLPCVKRNRSKSKFGLKQSSSSNYKSFQQLDLVVDQIPLDNGSGAQTPLESVNYRGWYQNQRSFRKVDALQTLVLQMQHKLIGTNQLDMKQYKAFDVFDIDYASIKEMKPKIMQGGGYFFFQNNKWNRSNEDTQDVSTLIRNVMLIQIMMNGFSVKSCLSEDGKHILCYLYAHEENLKTLAEKQKLKKKLNFWFTDLFSLEPVDNCFRPLRMNNRIWKPQEYNDVTAMFLYLRPKIIKLIDEINFKRISRETNQSRINGQLFQYGKIDLQDDEDQPNDEQWFAFYQYLVHLEKEISQHRKSFRIDSDYAAIINGQLKPYDLYVLRNQKNEQVKKLNKNNLRDEQNRYHQQEIKKIQQNVLKITSEYQNFLTQNELPNTKLIKLFKKERLAQVYHTLFEEALKVANSQKQLLFTIWDLIDVEKLEPYYTYSKPSQLISPVMKFQHIMCWCKYELNEFRKISLFSTSERLKLTDQAINNLFLLNDLMNKQLVSSFFCVNDHYELFGHLTSSQNDIMVEEDFFRKKMYHLEFEWSFNIQKPWSAPIIPICDYYGQKIGLYFYYQTYYTKMLLKIAFIALGCNLVQWILQDNESHLYYLIRIAFAFVQIQWTNLFVVLWQKKQIIFNLQFGQSGKDEIQVQRSNFVGQSRRSIENDQLNNISIDETELYTRMVLATFILIFLIMVYSGLMIALYVLTVALKVQLQDDKAMRDATFEVMVTATLNIVVIQFLDKVYDQISIRLTDFENQKTVKDYEESFVAKKYILYFVSYVGPLIVIAFLNQPLHLYCQQTNCQEHIQYHFATMIIWVFFFKTIKIFQLIINVKKIPIFRYQFNNESISKYVQEQSNRKSYAISQERYGTLEDYMEIFLQNTLLSIFGYSFPFSFFLLWVQNIAQMQADKAKFVYFLQRPWPQNNSSLGVWNKILELINYVCILTNTGQMTMEYNRKYGYEIILVYMAFLISNFAMNFIMNATFGQIPYELNLLISRQKYLIKSTIERFQKNSTTGQQSKQDVLKKFPIFKIYASVCDLQKGDFETVSSEDELESHYDLNQMKFLCKNIQKKEQKKPIVQNDKQKKQVSNTHINDKQMLKQKLNENKQKDLLKEEIMSDGIMLKYFQRRQFNLYFEIKSWKRNHPKLFLKAIKFLYQKQLLSLHKHIWCDRRVASRVLYMRRKTVKLRELELRKYLLLRVNEKKVIETYKEKAKVKFRKQFKMLDPKSQRFDDQQELEQLQKKFDEYVNKHSWLESTKTIVIKVKGLWFNQFRKQKKKTRSLNLVKEFFFKTQLLDKMKGESLLQDQVDQALGDIHKLGSVTLEQYIKAFWSVSSNSKEEYDIPLSTRELNMFDYYRSKKKSEIMTFIVDKFRDTYVFDYQYQKLQEINMQFFEEELFPIEPVNLQRQMNETVWIAQDSKEKQCLIQFLQIRHEEILQIQPVCLENYGVYYVYGQPQIRLSNLVDQIDDFYIKGYCVFKYEIQCQYNLKNILRYRSIYSLDYTLNELHEFLHANLMILKNRSHGDINIENYYLQGRSYVLLQSTKQNDDILGLSKVLIEMILLQPVETVFEGYKQLNPFHPLRNLLMQMIYEYPTIDSILDKIISKHSFMEYNINQDERHQKIQQDCNLLGQLALQTHQINFNFRMKHHIKTLQEIEKLELFLMKKKFKEQEEEDFQESFLLYLKINQNTILSNPKEIKLLTNILLIMYIKYATHLLTKKNFINDMERLYQALMRSVENIDDLIKQVSMKIKLEQLSTTEQKILLRRKLTRSRSSIDISSLDRFSLINKIRKHPNYVKVIYQLRKELIRYSLQLQALNSIYLYFNKNFLYSAQILENVQKILTELIQSEHKITQVVEDPQDLSPSQFNFDQQSPTLDATLKQYQDQAFELEKEMDTSPNYCLQLLFYKYLQLLVWYDGGKETFSNNCIDFTQMKIESPIVDYFKANLKVLQKLEIPKEYIQKHQNCEIGKFIVVQLNKWIEQTYFVAPQYKLTDDFQFMWKQIMTYSTIEQSIENREILVKQLHQQKMELKYILFEIRATHQLLHLDNYRPLDQYINFMYLDMSNCKYNFINESLINRLKHLHNQISIETNSWFHSSGLLQLRFFYILSICFTFSRKHFENMAQEASNLVYLVEIILEKVVHITESDAYRMKAYQILQKPNSLFELKSDPKPNQVNQIVSSFFYLSQNYNLQEKTQFFQTLLDKYGEQVKPSIVVLALISYFLSKGQKDIAELLVKLTVKMIHLEAQIFQNAHLSFVDDLHSLSLEFNLDVIEYLYPYDCLFKRTIDIRSFSSDQTILNLKYLIYNQFFHHDIDFNIDVLEDYMKLFDQNPNLKNLKSIYELFIILQKLIRGENFFEEIEHFIKLEVITESAYSTIVKSLLARYYINYKEFDKAKPLLESVMSFIYSIQIKSKFILQVQKQNYKILNYLNIFQDLFQVEQIEVEQQESDNQYIHLLDEQFIQETIINYLEVLANIQGEKVQLPSIASILSFFFQIKSFATQQNLFKALAQIFLSYASPQGVEQVIEQLGNSVEQQIYQYVQQRNQLKERLNHLFLIKQLSIEESNRINSQINLYNFAIGIYDGIGKGITNKTILTWSISSAEKSIIGYKIISKNFLRSVHFQISDLHLILVECFIQLEQLSTIMLHLEAAEEELVSWFKQNQHPLKAYFLIKSGALRPWIYQQFKQYVSQMIELPRLNKLNIFTIIRGLILCNRKLFQIFEQNSQDLISLEANLLYYLRSLEESQQVKGEYFLIETGNDPEVLLKQITQISPFDFNGVNILLDAMAILQQFNQNNPTTQKLQVLIDQQIIDQDQVR